MKSQLFVSVIVPVYNCERYLAEAIGSVIGQAYRPIEVIVVDDGSTDGSAALVKSLDVTIRYIYQQNRGPAAARNTGLAMARGDVIAFLDADDYWPENRLSHQVALLKESPSLEIIVGLIQRIKLRRRGGYKSLFEKWLDPFFAVSLGAAVFRRNVFEKVGLFDETLYYGEDVDWFMRAREQNVSMTVIEHVVLLYRMHESNMTLNAMARDSYFLRALKKSLDRRRLEGGGSVAPVAKLDGLERLMKYPPRTN